jgi:hypothetical protein
VVLKKMLIFVTNGEIMNELKKLKRWEIMEKLNRTFFINRLEDLGMTQRALAKALDIDSGALSNMLHGRRKMLPNEAVKIAEVLRLQLDDVLEAAGVKIALPRGITVTHFVDEHSNIEKASKANEFEVNNPSLPMDSIAVQIRNRQSPLDGWVMFFAGHPTNADIALNQVCMVKASMGLECIATVTKGYRANSYNLLSFIGNNKPVQQDISIAAVHPLLLIKPV